MENQALFEEALADLERAVTLLSEMSQVTHVTTTLEAAKSAQGKLKAVHAEMIKTVEPVEEKPVDMSTPETVSSEAPVETKSVGTTSN